MKRKKRRKEEVRAEREDEECGGDKGREAMRGRDKERERGGRREETSVSHPNRHFR